MKLFRPKSRNSASPYTLFKTALSEKSSQSKDQELIVKFCLIIVTQLLSMHTGAPVVQKEEVKAEGEKQPENLIDSK